MIPLVTLLNFLLVIATTMKDEVIKYPLYASSNDMMRSRTNDMQWYDSTP
jgi:hypothetical protein